MGPPPFLTAGCSSISHVACQLRGAMSCGILQAPEIAGVIYESWIIWPWVLTAPPCTCLIPRNHWSQIIEGQRCVREGGKKAQWLQERPAHQLLQKLKTPLVTALNTACSRHLKGRRVWEEGVEGKSWRLECKAVRKQQGLCLVLGSLFPLLPVHKPCCPHLG